MDCMDAWKEVKVGGFYTCPIMFINYFLANCRLASLPIWGGVAFLFLFVCWSVVKIILRILQVWGFAPGSMGVFWSWKRDLAKAWVKIKFELHPHSLFNPLPLLGISVKMIVRDLFKGLVWEWPLFSLHPPPKFIYCFSFLRANFIQEVRYLLHGVVMWVYFF